MRVFEFGKTQAQRGEPLLVSIFCTATNFALAVWILVALGAVFFTTLGVDEAWVLNGLKSLLVPWVPNASVAPVSTSGGLFALANIILEFLFGSRVWVHRLFSLACLFALIGVLLLARIDPNLRFSHRLLLIAPVLALPGTAEIASMALGTSTAVLMMVLASIIWTSRMGPSVSRIILCGVLFGLSASSRFELVLFAPALLITDAFCALREKQSLKTLLPVFIVIAIGLALFTLNQIFFMLAVESSREPQTSQQLMSATGLQLLPMNYISGGLNRVSRAIGFLPPFLIVLSLAGFVWPTVVSNFSLGQINMNKLRFLLFTAGLILIVGWTLRAPIPYLRYIWPSMVCFAILLGLLLVQILSAAVENKEWKKVAFCQAIAFVLILSGTVGSARSVIMGESDYMSWEWAGQISKDRFVPFQHAQDQIAIVNFIKNALPTDSVIMAHYPNPLRYQTGKPILDANNSSSGPITSGKFYLILTPIVGTFLYLDPQKYKWIEANAILVAQFGRYSVYEFAGLSSKNDGILSIPWGSYTGHPLSKSWYDR